MSDSMTIMTPDHTFFYLHLCSPHCTHHTDPRSLLTSDMVKRQSYRVGIIATVHTTVRNFILIQETLNPLHSFLILSLVLLGILILPLPCFIRIVSFAHKASGGGGTVL